MSGKCSPSISTAPTNASHARLISRFSWHRYYRRFDFSHKRKSIFVQHLNVRWVDGLCSTHSLVTREREKPCCIPRRMLGADCWLLWTHVYRIYIYSFSNFIDFGCSSPMSVSAQKSCACVCVFVSGCVKQQSVTRKHWLCWVVSYIEPDAMMTVGCIEFLFGFLIVYDCNASISQFTNAPTIDVWVRAHNCLLS